MVYIEMRNRYDEAIESPSGTEAIRVASEPVPASRMSAREGRRGVAESTHPEGPRGTTVASKSAAQSVDSIGL
jgi:hypothetical protein